MRISPRNLRILGASLIAVLMVVGGYALPGFQFPKTKAVNAELTDDILAEYVSKDTDADGLPDWQEVLYGTNSNVADTDRDGISDGEAVRRGLLTPTSLSSQLPQEPIGEEEIPGEAPETGSLTEEFSRALFEAYVTASRGEPLSAESQQSLIENLLDDFAQRAGREINSPYSQVSIRTNSAVTISEYAASVESIIRRNDINLEGKKPSELMQAAVENNDEVARQKLIALANAQAAAVQELLSVPVPPVLVDEHLLFVRSTDSLAKATRLVSEYKTDPIGTMGALIAYAPASQDFVTALKGIANVIVSQGDPMSGEPGAYVVSIVRSLENI